MTTQRIAQSCAAAGAVLFGAGGLWCLVSPHSFFEQVATYPPYNVHLFHDLGAFQLGIAASLAAGLVGRSTLAAGLWGAAVGATGHALSHWEDAELGGRSTDPLTMSVVAAVLVAGLIAAEYSRRPQGPTSPDLRVSPLPRRGPQR